MAAKSAAPTTLDPLDFLALDTLLDEEEKAIRDTVRAFVRERIVPEVGDWFERGGTRRKFCTPAHASRWRKLQWRNRLKRRAGQVERIANERSQPPKRLARIG